MAPSAPTNVRWERTSDRNMTLKWNAVAGARSYGIRVQYGGVNGKTELRWRNIRKTSFQISGWGVNLGYRLSVWASSGDGWTQSQNSSYSSWTPWFYTPPKAPVGLKVKVLPNRDVQLDWTSTSYYRTGIYIERQVGVGVQTFELGNGTGGNAGQSWTDTDVPGDVKVRYRVRQFVGREENAPQNRVFGSPTAWSPYVRGGYADPLAPKVSLTNAAQGSPLAVKWTYVPTDFTTLNSAEIRYRLNGSSAWTTVQVGQADTVSRSHNISGLAAGLYDVQVRSFGPSGLVGPYSAVQTVRVVSRPTVAVLAPTSPLDAGRAKVEWSFSQAEGLPQTGATVKLVQGNQVLEEKALVGQVFSHEFGFTLEDQTSYKAQVVVTSGGVSSSQASKTFATDFTRPAPPTLEVVWDDQQGAHLVVVGAYDFRPAPSPHSLAFYRKNEGKPPQPTKVFYEVEISGDEVFYVPTEPRALG